MHPLILAGSIDATREAAEQAIEHGVGHHHDTQHVHVLKRTHRKNCEASIALPTITASNGSQAKPRVLTPSAFGPVQP